MKKMFGPMMEEFLKGMSEEDQQKMKTCFDAMAAKCPCADMPDMSEEAKREMMEKMKSFCGSKMQMMSSFPKCSGLR